MNDCDEETHEEYTKRRKVYNEFECFWLSIPITWNEKHEPQKKFMFDFLFRLLVSCWDDFSDSEQSLIKFEAKSYLSCSEGELTQMLIDWKKSLPKFSVSEDRRNIESANSVQLLQELVASEDVCAEYTLNEGVSMTPFFIDYPPEFAFQLLNHMGHERGMYPETE